MQRLSAVTSTLVEDLRRAAWPLTGAVTDLDPLVDLVGDARFVLIGEASHGTHDFYRLRAELTQRLILEKGFTAVAAEADWPDAYRVNCYVRGDGGDPTANAALANFRRFPTWMWRNTVVLEFVDWLREHNGHLPAGAPPVGFFGLDLYSLSNSAEEVLRYLDRVDPGAARRARERYACFAHYGEDAQADGYEASLGLAPSCEQEVVHQLVELQRNATEYLRRDGHASEDDLFYAEQNARLVKNAEEYYRTMLGGSVSSWNLRDRHMADTLDALEAHLARRGQPPRIVVWEHNSHLGDARATEMGERGEWNVGQLARERHPGETVNIGFTTDHGSVTAADDWDQPPQRMQVQPGLPGSYEELFHQVNLPRFLLTLRGSERWVDALREPRLERAIGVIYRPQTERWSHYFNARLADQFDAVIHVDESRALEPLERTAGWASSEAPETYPFAV